MRVVKRGSLEKRKGLLEWRAERTPVARGDEVDMCFEFCGAEEGRERAGFASRDPGARGAVGAECGFDLLGVRGE